MSIVALVLAAGAAHAATVQVNGGSMQGPGVGPAGVNTSNQFSFNGASQNNNWSGVVRWSNTADQDQQCLSLTLTAFTFTGTGQANETITISLVQDYTLDPGAMGGTASNQINGDVTFSSAGQLATGTVVSTHNAGGAPTVINNGFNPGNALSSGAGVSSVQRGAASAPVQIVGNIWRIATTYTFTVNAAGGTVSIHLPDSGVDNTCLALVPLPRRPSPVWVVSLSSAWARPSAAAS
ncbi:MAG: hypothetical protein U0640_12280 [Phycisphaerales bacterium]